MKKIVLFILAIALFYGCSKKDEGSNAPITIVGKWYYYKDTAKVYNGNNTFAYQTVNTISLENYIQFNADGGGRNSAGSFSYTISGNQLSINSTYNTISTIKSISSDNLVLYSDIYYNINGLSFSVKETDYLSR